MRIPGWLQFVLILCFLALPILSAPRVFENGFSLQGPLVRMFIVYALFVVFFYFHYYVLLDRFFYKKRYFLYAFCVLFSFVLILLIPEMIRYFTGTLDIIKPPMEQGLNHLNHHRPPFWTEYPRHFFLFVSTLLLGHFMRTNERLLAARQEKIQAELSFLKAQINPHFLFNTLNTIYSLSLTKSDRTPDAVVQLSGMMRHVLVDSQTEKISLQKELDYVRNYVELQKLRIDEGVKLDFSIVGEPGGKDIAPLLLIPFIENAFKYGVNPEQNSAIKIEIGIDKGILTMNVSNQKVDVVIRDEERTKVGLENVKSRLILLYTDKHMLNISDNLDTFDVTLTIIL
jgi:sensor histidine kinase YesM